MHSDRLTRQELTWLLTQEARSAADKLRKGVAVLAPPQIRGLTNPPGPSIEPELDALDDAMKMLASLHTGTTARGRRGRIDVAALLWDVAPQARVSIEPGSGTEVFGDESELRRMLQVMVGSISPSAQGSEMGTPELSIRRDGAEIRVSVTLGPDSSANAETERAWLSRMAIRYGGRFELEGATESIILPADGANEHREVESLRRELEAAQRQGEAYARELAAVFSYSQSPPPRFSSKPAEAHLALSAITAMAAGMGHQIRAVFGAVARETATRGGPPPGSDRSHEPSDGVSDLVGDLRSIADCPVFESVQHVNLADAVRAAMADLEGRATRRGVLLKSHIPSHLDIASRPGAVVLLARTLIADAIQATPHGGTVTVTLEEVSRTGRLFIDDGGHPLPNDAFHAIAEAQVDAATLGRPSTLALFYARKLAQHLEVQFEPASGDQLPAGVATRLEIKFVMS